MDCLTPIFVRNLNPGPGDYEFNKVPCGRCAACLMRYRSQWFTRLRFETDNSDYAYFVTLTYDDEHLPSDESVNKRDVQLFLKRLRSVLPSNVTLKYYIVAEYGSEYQRPHYHGIFWNIPPWSLDKIEFTWENGFVKIDEINDNRLRYVCGYIIEKTFVPKGRAPVFNLISKRLGASYIDKFSAWHSAGGIMERSYVPYHGQKLSLPRYYKEKLYSEKDRKSYAEYCEQKALENEYKGRLERGDQAYFDAVAASDYQIKYQLSKQNKKKKGQ